MAHFLHSALSGKDSSYIILTLFLDLCITTFNTDGAVIETTNVVILNENQQTAISVAEVECTDGTDMLVNGTFSPTTFCTFCFIVQPATAANKWDVFFYPSVASLNFVQVPEYDITLTCFDLDNGTNFVSEVVEVRLRPNSPPEFDDGLTDQAAVANTKTVTAGTTLHTVDATDPNGDAVQFTLVSTDPVSSNFEIGLTDGVISAVNDLSAECINEIDLFVTITDGMDTTGPQIIDMTLSNSNQVPEITNTADTSSVAEDSAVGTTVMTLAFTDADTGDTPTASFTTSPDTAQTMFTLNAANELVTATTLDYEDFSLRRPKVLFTVTDGGCTSTTFTYTVSITNINEAPVISPEDSTIDVYEGDIVVDPSWTTTDPDALDTLTYSISASIPTASNLEIDPSTGVISSTVEYDVDGGAMSSTVTLTIQVSDAAGLTDTTTVTLSIKDRNDNDPEFTTVDQAFTVTECSQLGTQLGTVVATDADSSFQDNNVITYSKTSGSSKITVTPGGAIIHNEVFTAGTSETFTIVATDLGQFPSALTSAVPATVTVSSTDCPTTTSTTTTTTASTTTTTTTTTTQGTAVGADDENLPWIVLAALLGVVFFALLAWLCMTRAMPYCGPGSFGPRWFRACQCGGEGLCQRRKPKIKVQPEKPKESRFEPANGNPAFWKERFHDDDYTYKPAHHSNRIPEAANYDQAPSTHYHDYRSQQGVPQPNSYPDPPPGYEKRDTARIWSTERNSDFRPPGESYVDDGRDPWAPPNNKRVNYDTMDGIV